MAMESLSFHDFRDTKFDPNWSRFHCLLQVAKVAEEKLEKQNFIIRNGEEKKSQDFGYLKNKYFLYNAPQPQTLSRDDNMGFKQSFNNNVGLHKKRKLKDEDGEWDGLKVKVKKSKKEKPAAAVCPIPPPDLPDTFKQHIVEKMGGSGWVLVIQKPIFFSDINPGASRFSIPFSQLKTREFLNKEEAEDLDAKKAMEVCLLEPSMNETNVSFNRWYMQKSSSYVMTTKWNYVVKNNRLKIGDIVQLWSFRVNSKLCFALVKVQAPTRNKNGFLLLR